MRVLHRSNGGAAAARNTGLEAATGQWMAFLDADDLWFPEHLEELKRVVDASPEAGLVGTAYIESDGQGRWRHPPPHEGIIRRIHYFHAVGSGRLPFWIGSSAAHRRTIERLGGFRVSRYGDDSEFLVRRALHFPVASSTRETAVWMHGTGGITDNARHRWQDAQLRSPADIAPAVALLLDHCSKVEAEAVPPGVDRFVDQYVRWCLRSSVAIGDVRTIRRLRSFFRRPTLSDRMLLATAHLPPGATRSARWIKQHLRRLSRARGSMEPPS
jgi:glycosyltransferase involved in cell wall biosynthesis